MKDFNDLPVIDKPVRNPLPHDRKKSDFKPMDINDIIHMMIHPNYISPTSSMRTNFTSLANTIRPYSPEDHEGKLSDHDTNTIPTDLLGDKGREHIRKVNEGVSKRIRVFMDKHYGFNPENS